MKKRIKLLGIIALIAIIGLTFTACDFLLWLLTEEDTAGIEDGTQNESSCVHAFVSGFCTKCKNIEMVQIPAGKFMMGSPSSEPNTVWTERPQREVTLNAFKMGKYEVTQEQYQTVMGMNPSYFHGGSEREPAPGEVQSRRPVDKVTWFDAVEFCNKLSQRAGLTSVYTITGRTPATGYPITDAAVTANWNANGYRLPTEAEWEYACRAGTTTAYNTGATMTDSTGWYGVNSGDRTREVGKKPANSWGLHDMHGNVSEWCWDWWVGAYYAESGNTNNPRGPASGSFGDRVDRGGDYQLKAPYLGHLRSAYRGMSPPDIELILHGFRVVRN